MTRCLVVGGGFLGTHIAYRLAHEGREVTIFSRSFNEWLFDADRSGGGKIRLVEGEVPPGGQLGELIEESDAVFYTAGVSSPAAAHEDPGGSITSYVVPAVAILDLMRPTSTRRLVLASSGGTVYGAPQVKPTPESVTADPVSFHGHNSLTVERYVEFSQRHHGLDPVILRFSNPYGPGQLERRGQGVIAAWLERLARNRELLIYGDPATRRDFVYVDDAAEAATAVGLTAAAGIYNVGSGRSWSLEDLLGTIEKVTGRAARTRAVGSRGVDVPVTELDCSRLRSATGWTPRTSLEDGIRSHWAWIQARPYPRG